MYTREDGALHANGALPRLVVDPIDLHTGVEGTDSMELQSYVCRIDVLVARDINPGTACRMHTVPMPSIHVMPLRRHM